MRTPIWSTFMPVRAGSWQQGSNEGSKLLRWDSIGDFWTFPIKTKWRTRRFAAGSRMQSVGVHNDLLTMGKKRKLRWYGYISRTAGMAKTSMLGTVKGAKSIRQKERWEWKTTSKNGQKWVFGDSLRARKTEKCRNVLLVELLMSQKYAPVVTSCKSWFVYIKMFVYPPSFTKWFLRIFSWPS